MGRQGTQGEVRGIPCCGHLGDRPRVSGAPTALWLLLVSTRVQHGRCNRGGWAAVLGGSLVHLGPWDPCGFNQHVSTVAAVSPRPSVWLVCCDVVGVRLRLKPSPEKISWFFVMQVRCNVVGVRLKLEPLLGRSLGAL